MAFAHPDYTLLRELGHGGSATVYLAVQNSLNRRVALKVMHGPAAGPSDGRRFLREARIIAKLHHPHIVPVYTVGEAPHGAGFFMAMEYLPGGSLSQRAATLTVADLLRTLQQVCAALQHAHQQGFVHRDVKPDNILFRSNSHALLADFGIARATTSLTRITMTGTMLGTPDYMSPEQVAGDEVGLRSDLYSLGVTLFELLAGYRPFRGDSAMAVGLQQIAAEPPPLPDNLTHFQPLLDSLLAKCPEARPATAAELSAELTRLVRDAPLDPEQRLTALQSGQVPERPGLPAALTAPRPPSRRRRRMFGAAAMSIAVGLGSLTLYRQATDSVPPASQAIPQPGAAQVALASAHDAFRLDRWFGPGQDTALALYRRVLALEPDNREAAARLDDMFTTTAQRARSAADGGALERAGELIDTLRDGWPGDARLPALDAHLRRTRALLAEQRQAGEADARVRELLLSADRALRRGSLLAPVGDSAADHYRKALRTDPDNALAAAGLSNIADRLLNQADSALRDDDFETVQRLLEQVQTLTPEHPRITTLAARAGQRRSELAAAAAERRAQAELQEAVAALSERVDAWMAGRQLGPEEHLALSADLNALSERAPDHAELRSLLALTERHSQRLAGSVPAAGDAAQEVAQEAAADDAAAEEADDDRFRFGSF